MSIVRTLLRGISGITAVVLVLVIFTGVCFV